MKMDFQKIRERLGVSNDKPLTPEEKRRRAKYIVYPFFCLLCMGFLLLVFSPSEKEKAEMEKGRGFNVEMPSPEDSEMEGNKVSAYEQEALAKKEKWRRGTFQEMSELLNKDDQDTAGLTAGKANMELPPEPEKGKAPGSIRSPSTRVPPTSTVPFGIRRSSTAIGSSRRIRSACPSDTVCVPCTQAAMVFLPEDGILPTGVWKPVFLSPAYPEAMSSLPAGWASDDTIRFCTRFTGRTAVRSFRLFGAFVVEEASCSFPL